MEKNMKFIIKIEGTEVLLDGAQVEALTNILQNCEKLYDKNVEKGQGTHGYNNCYIHHLKPFNCSESLNLKVMPTDQYEATKLITKLNKED
jgi:hypothetical protein